MSSAPINTVPEEFNAILLGDWSGDVLPLFFLSPGWAGLEESYLDADSGAIMLDGALRAGSLRLEVLRSSDSSSSNELRIPCIVASSGSNNVKE